jgi:hypothetical protein
MNGISAVLSRRRAHRQRETLANEEFARAVIDVDHF